MTAIRLGEIFELKYGKALKKENRLGGDVAVYGSNGIVGYHNQSLVNIPTVVVGRKGSIGEVHLTEGPSWPIDTTYYAEFKEKDVDLSWFYILLKGLRLNELNRSAAIPGLNRDDVYKIKVVLPALQTQTRIAALLNRVETLITTRKRNLRQLDDFLKSTFLEMFGNPVSNEKGWEKPELSEFGAISTGNTPPRKDPSNYNSKYIEWTKTDNIDKETMYVSKAKEYLSKEGAAKGRILSKGAVLVACIAGSIESIGRAAITDRTIAFNQQINAIQPNKGVNSIFLYWLLKISQKYIQGIPPKGMKKIVSKGVFEKIKLINPPSKNQELFAEVANKVYLLKQHYIESLDELENLYNVLSQKAFKGELDLTRIPLPIIDNQAVASTREKDREKVVGQTIPELVQYPMSHQDTREALLHSLFVDYINLHKGANLQLSEFWQLANLKALDMMNETDQPWGPDDYDQLKEWLFDMIRDGKLEQAFVEDTDDSRNSKIKLTING